MGRARAVEGPILQASLAAGIAWYVAHDLLGHAQPFFAPIAAAISLSTSHVQRSRRTVQMVVGVLLGIGVAELLHQVVGDGALPIGVVVLVTMLLAAGLGVGFVGEGMMFANQAAASAVLVIALHRAGTGAERATDAIVGGAVALVIGVGLFPADPLKLLWGAESGVLSSLAAILERRTAAGARRGAGSSELADREADSHGLDPEMAGMKGMEGVDWTLAASHDVHRQLSALTQARGTARVSVRVAPRRMPMRGLVEMEEVRVARLYLLASAVLSLMRTMFDLGERGASASGECVAELDELAAVMHMLLDARRPWSLGMVQDVTSRMRALLDRPLPRASPEDAILTSASRRVARDVIAPLPAPRCRLRIG